MALYGPVYDNLWREAQSNTSDTSFSGGGGWQNYMNRSFTSTARGPIIVSAAIALGYESGAVNAKTRFILGSSVGNAGNGTSMEFGLGVQRHSNRLDSGTGALLYNFNNIAAGSYVVTWQVNNTTSNTTLKLGGLHNPGSGSQMDNIHVMYCKGA